MNDKLPAAKPSLLYRSLITLLLPMAAIHGYLQTRGEADFRYFWQRLGKKYPKFEKQPIWFHCASVGEVRAIKGLLGKLRSLYPQIPVVISTNTTTGCTQVLQLADDAVTHVYLPFDSAAAVKQLLAAINPRIALIVETEIWPSLYYTIHQQNIPLLIINGRLSHKTLQAPQWLRGLYASSLKLVTEVLARSQQDADGFIALGAPVDKVTVTGNIKLASIAVLTTAEFPRLITQRYWLAASTHDNEEELLAQHALQSDALLVIAPRHPVRLAQIERQLGQLNINYCVRSRGENITTQTQIYLADTLGEMESLMKHAELVFMGGSLVPVGGHNLLEPAALGKAVMSGMHLHNFKSESKLLSENSAIVIVASAQELAKEVTNLLADDTKRQQLGQAAVACAGGGEQVLESYIASISAVIAGD